MALTALQFIEGILKIANLFLIVIAAVIAAGMFKAFGKRDMRKEALPWRLLIIVLILLTVQTILGALRAFLIWDPGAITRVIPTVMLGLIIWALVLNINMKK